MITNGQARAAVVAEAMTWLGTPYHHHARIKGTGVDCAQLLIAVYAECELVPAVDPGKYPVEWHLHQNEEKFAEWLERVGAREVQTPAPGDIALFRYGRTYSHGGIVVGEQILHAYMGLGVCLHRLTEAPLAGRPVKFWSIWS